MYKILLIDPDQRSRDELKKLLINQGSGFSLQDCAESLACALNLFRERHYSLVLINMTHLNQEGWQICEHIRKNSNIPIFLIGGKRDFQLVRKALNLRVNDYLPDPVHPNEIMKSLQTLKQDFEGNPSPGHRQIKQVQQSIGSTKSPTSIIEKVKSYVAEAINQNVTLKEISDTYHYNCSYLGQKFKSHENMTFNEYLLQQRMEMAKILLDNTNMKIYEIANEVGYRELDWFYKKFKSYTGISATEYRKLSIME